MDHTAVNAAIVEYLGLWWSPEREQALEADLGSEGAAAILTMYRFAVDQTDLWLGQPTEVAYPEVQRRLRREYPFLTAEAVQRLANMAAFTWK
jgi:hypothetical protein